MYKVSLLKTKLCAECYCRERSCVQSVIHESEAVCKVSFTRVKLCAKWHLHCTTFSGFESDVMN